VVFNSNFARKFQKYLYVFAKFKHALESGSLSSVFRFPTSVLTLRLFRSPLRSMLKVDTPEPRVSREGEISNNCFLSAVATVQQVQYSKDRRIKRGKREKGGA